MAEERMRDDTCPTCGGPVVVQGDGLTHWYRPAPTDQGERDGLAERLEAQVETLDLYNEHNYIVEAEAAGLMREAASVLRTSTEGGARPGDTPLNDTRTNSDRPWREDVARAFVTNRPAQPEGAGDDLAARLDETADKAQARIGRRGTALDSLWAEVRDAAREAAQLARASTHPEQWVSGDDREWLLWITSYVLNRHEFTDSAATDARAALTRIATAIKQPASPTPTEQGEDRTRVEWHDGIEHGDELALRQLAADIGCGIPYGCQPSVGKWYAAALDRVLDRLLPLHPDVSRRMNRWREHLGDDRLNGFGGRGPAEYAFMAENEPEGPGLSRFGEDCGEAS